MIQTRITRIARLALNVRDLDRTIAFYCDALGFAVAERGADRARLAIGAQAIELVHTPDAAPYPEQTAANDPWFQHFAIPVADMAAAYAHLAGFTQVPISAGGPQLLPPNTGSVTAYKFRDPEGHPLELSFAPGSDWSRATSGALFLGIDHTALAVRDLEASIAFYSGLGFREGGRSLNQGPEQSRLDGLGDAVVEIVNLLTPDAGPHIELLHYRYPKPVEPRVIGGSDIAATRIVLDTADLAVAGRCVADPDGHLLLFT